MKIVSMFNVNLNHFFYLTLSEVVLALGDIAALCVILIRPKWRGSSIASAASKVRATYASNSALFSLWCNSTKSKHLLLQSPVLQNAAGIFNVFAKTRCNAGWLVSKGGGFAPLAIVERGGCTVHWREDNFVFGKIWKFCFVLTYGIHWSFGIFHPTFDE